MQRLHYLLMPQSGQVEPGFKPESWVNSVKILLSGQHFMFLHSHFYTLQKIRCGQPAPPVAALEPARSRPVVGNQVWKDGSVKPFCPGLRALDSCFSTNFRKKIACLFLHSSESFLSLSCVLLFLKCCYFPTKRVS